MLLFLQHSFFFKTANTKEVCGGAVCLQMANFHSSGQHQEAGNTTEEVGTVAVELRR